MSDCGVKAGPATLCIYHLWTLINFEIPMIDRSHRFPPTSTFAAMSELGDTGPVISHNTTIVFLKRTALALSLVVCISASTALRADPVNSPPKLPEGFTPSLSDSQIKQIQQDAAEVIPQFQKWIENPSSPPYWKTRKITAEEAEVDRQQLANRNLLATVGDKPVVKHIVVKNGQPFPEKKAVLPVAPQAKPISEQVAKDSQEEAVKKIMNTPELPQCAEAKTRTMDAKLADFGDNEFLVYDALFLPSVDNKLNNETTSGELTEILGVGASPDEAINRAFARQSGATCVPYRIRMTSHKIIRYEGEDALKNYDEAASDKK